MPFVHRLGERVGDAGTDANQSCLLDAELGCDLISGAEADAADVAGQTIRVLRDEPNGIGAVSLVDAHGARRTDSVAVQKQHDLSNHPLLGPAGDDPLSTLRADAGHLAQAIGLLLDDLEDGFAEGADELLRIDRPDAADHPGAEIFLDALDGRRRCSLEERGFELDAVGAIVDPASARLDELTSRDHRCVADNRDQVALPASFDPQHAKTVLRVCGRSPGRPSPPGPLSSSPSMSAPSCDDGRRDFGIPELLSQLSLKQMSWAVFKRSSVAQVRSRLAGGENRIRTPGPIERERPFRGHAAPVQSSAVPRMLTY
jgi:hypothetical protein